MDLVTGQQEDLPRVTGLTDTGPLQPRSAAGSRMEKAERGVRPGLVLAERGALWEPVHVPFLQWEGPPTGDGGRLIQRWEWGVCCF